MERRDASKSEQNDPFQPDSGAALDLFGIDLGSELPGVVHQNPELVDLQPLDADPFSDEFQLADLPNGEDPFASLPEIVAEVVDSPVLAVVPGFAASRATNGLVAATAVPASVDANPVAEETVVTQADLVRRRFYLTALPSWAISLGVHVAVLFLLAALSMEPIREAIGVALEAGGGNEGETLDDTELPGPAESVESAATSEEISASTPIISEVVSMPVVTTTAVSTVQGVSSVSMNNVTESVLPSSMMGSGLSKMMTSLNGRGAGMKGEMLERFGGTANSEKAVAAGLKWIAAHQAPNGGWSFACSRFCRGQCKGDGTKSESVNAATALALLPFLGAGQTHLEGPYKDTIKKGLAFLIQNMKVTPGATPHGSWHEPGGTMYSHGLASIAICEAYAMTRDPDLVQPAQLALNFLVYAQDPRGGGWRYAPREPGDTSVVGWCLMALKSGSMGNLVVPSSSFRGASQFLDLIQTNDGAYYGYDKPSASIRDATTAIGLLCRMYLGWSKDTPAIKQGIARLSKTGPSVDNLYYSYYATQVMRHQGGEEWEKWNTKMREDLIKTQSGAGHEAGSWFSEGGHGRDGGRLYCTALATMTLEVYYRHMPLYTEKSSDDEFEL
jgi:Squalene-hopene cyclase C-terminal domain